MSLIRLAITFLIVALIAALFGFGFITGVAIELAKIVFIIGLVLAVIVGIIHALKGKNA